MSGFYAGIGSRNTPEEILELMFQIAYLLGEKQWTLRSGCAPGADTAFEAGMMASEFATAELFLPWKGFEGRDYDDYRTGVELLEEPEQWTFPIAERHHPAWGSLSFGGRKLQARNVHQILGPTPVKSHETSSFVICWTEGGRGGGGTGQAIRVANAYTVPVFDLARTEDRDRITRNLGVTT